MNNYGSTNLETTIPIKHLTLSRPVHMSKRDVDVKCVLENIFVNMVSIINCVSNVPIIHFVLIRKNCTIANNVLMADKDTVKNMGVRKVNARIVEENPFVNMVECFDDAKKKVVSPKEVVKAFVNLMVVSSISVRNVVEQESVIIKNSDMPVFIVQEFIVLTVIKR